MNGRDFDRFLLGLAGSGWSDRALKDILREFHRTPQEQILGRIRSIRDQQVSDANVPRSQRRLKHSNQDARTRAYELILSLKHLSASEKASMLTEALEKETLQIVDPFREKEGLRKWLVKLEDRFGPSELLHQITKIKNRYSDSKSSGWSLRDSNDQ